MLEFLVYKMFVAFGGEVSQQVIGIPMAQIVPSCSRHMTVFVQSGIQSVFALNQQETFNISVQLYV